MASHRIGETATGLSNAGPSSHHHLSFLGTNAPPSLIINQEGPSFEFGELEEAIVLQGLKFRNDDVKPTFVAGGGRPAATLEMFPSWPMRYQHTPRGSSKSGGESTDDSGSAANNNSSNNNNLPSIVHQNEQPETPISKLASSKENHQLALQQKMANDTSRSSGPSQNQPKSAQEVKKKEAGGSTSDKQLDAKTMRRLAQNREAARKSRLRKKAYVQQLESSRVKLTQLEQELQRARSQGIFLGGVYGGVDGNISSGAAIFDMEYTRWLEDDQRHISELRHCLQSHISDGDLRLIVDGYLSHYDEIFRLKGAAAKSDVFHLLTGMWASPVERCFLWMGGFRPSDLIKMLTAQLDPWTEQQLMGIYGLQQSSQQAEEALSQGLDELHRSLVDTVARGGPIVDGMQQMAVALGKVANLEGFVCQADNLRQQTLHQLRRILTIRQAARCFLVIGEYYSRLRALSSLWASRPREAMYNEDHHSGQTSTNLQVVQATQNHFLHFD